MTSPTKANVSLSTQPTAPAIIVFGTDDTGKPHASTFGIDQRHDAIRAAGLMGFQALAVEGDALIALAKLIPAGKVFSSGKGFVPFVKREVGEQLQQFAQDHPDQLITVPVPVASETDTSPDQGTSDKTPVATSAEQPKDWMDIKVGSRVLAVDDPDDGWWEAIVQHVHESGTQAHPCPMFTLIWEAFPDDGRFVRRFDQVALIHPAFNEVDTTQPDSTTEA
ncbi:hypothetical protein JQX22_25110 [Sulfitobacter pseudonitzschiae]|nr:hypothetical protein [Pseudosulfitobacter pseudonitzschiae]